MVRCVCRKAQVQAVEKGKAPSTGPRIFVARKPHWFEKFRWFISSDGVVVVAGTDAQQNEQLVKRYMRPQDVYVHADVHGAASCIVRNPSSRPDAADSIPPASLEQAGQFTVRRFDVM
jgi:predicted ribosome quality control (RQC) complex YloA/Tae2 family protein